MCLVKTFTFMVFCQFTLNQGAFVMDFQRNYFNSTRWPSNIITYSFFWNLDNEHRVMAQKALDMIQNKTCIRFVYEESPPRSLHFIWFRNTPKRVCKSHIGMRPVYNLVQGDKYCFSHVGFLLHELMHSLGFLHEHQRPDRQSYIRINWDHIYDDKKEQFAMHTRGSHTYNTPYDYNSIMHYKAAKFGYGGKVTIQPRYPESAKYMGQRYFLSKGDVEAINIVYCSKKGHS